MISLTLHLLLQLKLFYNVGVDNVYTVCNNYSRNRKMQYMTYLTVNKGAGLHLLKGKGEMMFDSVKNMGVGDTACVEKKDLSCFYAVARRHDLKFRRVKTGDVFTMVMVKNGYLDKWKLRMANLD